MESELALPVKSLWTSCVVVAITILVAPDMISARRLHPLLTRDAEQVDPFEQLSTDIEKRSLFLVMNSTA